MAEQKKNFTDRLWDFFCSLKLTIILLLLLAATSIIGTVLQQNAPAAEYIREYGQANYELFKKLQFIDMYHSSWFIGILGLFSVNLICCSLKNFPRAWKFVKEPMRVAASGVFKGSANKAEYRSKNSKEQVAEQLSALLRKKIGKTTLTEKDGKLHLFAQKGIYSRFGAYITHLSILIIMAGAIIGNIWGYKGYVNIVEGNSIDQVQLRSGMERIDLGFTVRCDDFEVIYYGNSQRPKDYFSDLVILENDKVVPINGKESTRIEVNKPLTYKGITFYQSSYGPAGNAFFKVRVTNNETGEVSEVEAPQGDHVSLPNGFSFAITNYYAQRPQFRPGHTAARQHPGRQTRRAFCRLAELPAISTSSAAALSASPCSASTNCNSPASKSPKIPGSTLSGSAVS